MEKSGNQEKDCQENVIPYSVRNSKKNALANSVLFYCRYGMTKKDLV